MDRSASSPEEVRKLSRDFLMRTGMSTRDFARRAGYHFTTIYQFLAGTYHLAPGAKLQGVCTACLAVVAEGRELGPEEFTGTLYEIGNANVMRSVFARLVEHPCILLCYAPPGSGKTDVARALMPHFSSAEVPIRRIYCRAAITKLALMRRIAAACGSIPDTGIERTIANLRYDFAGRRVVLYFDEAQHLSVECLETVRELFDELHWSLCFAGSHTLDRIFSKWSGDLEQLERRITDKVTLPAVTAEEADGIVRSELPGLAPTKVRALIERSHVEIRAARGTQRYLSIGRVMANVRELQERMPAAADEPEAVEAKEK